MDTSGNIFMLNDEEVKDLMDDPYQDSDTEYGNIRQEREKDLMLLKEQETKELKKVSHRRRKAWMRNKPCICGSGKKFKKCCWSRVTMKGKS